MGKQRILNAMDSIIGYARTAIFEYDNGSDVTAAATTYKAYLFDVQPLSLFKPPMLLYPKLSIFLIS